MRERQASEVYGRSNTLPPGGGVPEYLQGDKAPVVQPGSEGTLSRLGERLKIGGEVVTEFYDRNAERNLPATFGGPDNGASQFLIRRFDLNLGVLCLRALSG